MSEMEGGRANWASTGDEVVAGICCLSISPKTGPGSVAPLGAVPLWSSPAIQSSRRPRKFGRPTDVCLMQSGGGRGGEGGGREGEDVGEKGRLQPCQSR